MELDLIDFLIDLASFKWWLLGFPLVVGLLVAVVSLFVPSVFTATTRVLPPQSQSTSSALLAQQLGSLAGLAGAAGTLRNPSELYVGMLRSRTISDGIIRKFSLDKRYEVRVLSDAREVLKSRTSISAGRDGIILLEVDDHDAKTAADIANAYVDELFKLTRVIAVTEASQRRLFFERQLAEARENLTAAEAAARQAIDAGGLMQVEGQGKAILEAASKLRAEITVKEVQIGAMRTFAADRNPDLQLAQQQLESMRRELTRLEGPVNVAINKSGASESGQRSLALLRNLKYYETTHDLLAKQYEIAKIDEARDASVVQVIDAAVPPDRRSRPKRVQLVVLSAIGAGLAAILFLMLRHIVIRTFSQPARVDRVSVLKEKLGLSRH